MEIEVKGINDLIVEFAYYFENKIIIEYEGKNYYLLVANPAQTNPENITKIPICRYIREKIKKKEIYNKDLTRLKNPIKDITHRDYITPVMIAKLSNHENKSEEYLNSETNKMEVYLVPIEVYNGISNPDKVYILPIEEYGGVMMGDILTLLN